MLPSNQKYIIEKAKFTYSPSGKAFEKQWKAIEDQGKEQIDALEKTLKTLEAIKDKKSDDNEKLLKYKKFFDELSNKRIGKIYKTSKQIILII